MYVGGAYGESRVKDSSFNDNDHALKLFVGGKFNPYFGLELAANDFGDASNNGFSSELRGYTLAAVGFLPIMDNIELFGKAGRLWWRDKLSVSDSFSDSYSGNDNFYGVGINFNSTKALSFRVEVERYDVSINSDNIGIDIDSSAKVDVLSVGIGFNF